MTLKRFQRTLKQLISKDGSEMEYRWHIFLANLDQIIGSEQGKTRPVLVISEEEINQLLPVVSVLPITSRKQGRRIYPNEVLTPAGIGGLEKESIVLCYQIRTLDKKRFTKEIGKIDNLEQQEAIIDALCLQLGIIR